MTNGQSSGGSESDGHGTSAPALPLELLRERVVARRRRERQTENWNVVRARRQKVRMIAVSAGVLLLMAVGLYFELAHQNAPSPVDSAAPAGAARAVGIV